MACLLSTTYVPIDVYRIRLSFGQSINPLTWLILFKGHPPGVYTCSTKLQLHRSYDVSSASGCLKENRHGVHHVNLELESKFLLVWIPASLRSKFPTHPSFKLLSHPTSITHTTPRSLQPPTLHPSYWQCQQGRSIGHTQVFQGWLHPSSCPSHWMNMKSTPHEMWISRHGTQFGLLFSIFLLYIWSPHLVTKQSGVPSGILEVLFPSYPLRKGDFRSHFIFIQKNTTQWTQPTVAGSIIFQPIRNHEIWNKKQTAKSKGKPLKIVSNKLQMFLYIPPKQIGYSMFFQGKFHPSKTKKNRAFVEDSHVHIIPTLWQHGIMIWSQLHWKGLGFLKAASEWCKDVHFVGQKTSNLSFETPFPPWESHLFFFEFPCTIIEFQSPNSGRKAPTIGTIEQPGHYVPNCWSFS